MCSHIIVYCKDSNLERTNKGSKCIIRDFLPKVSLKEPSTGGRYTLCPVKGVVEHHIGLILRLSSEGFHYKIFHFIDPITSRGGWPPLGILIFSKNAHHGPCHGSWYTLRSIVVPRTVHFTHFCKVIQVLFLNSKLLWDMYRL